MLFMVLLCFFQKQDCIPERRRYINPTNQKKGFFMTIIKNFHHVLHGGDYNPDQWLHIPGTIDRSRKS